MQKRSLRPILKRTLFAAAVVTVVLAAAYLALAIYTPPPPEEWHKIKIGETRKEVLSKGVVQPRSYKAIRGMDQALASRKSLIYGEVGFLLQVMYDDDMRVESIIVHTVTDRFRLWVRTKPL